MKETFYLFKRAADGVWIFGNNADCEHQAGTCKPVPSTDRTKVSIIYFQKNDATPNIYDIPVENFLDEAGVAYADFAALKAGCYGFFFGEDSGIAIREEDAELSDTIDLDSYGWIQPTLLAGTIKYTTVAGNVRTKAFDLKEVSLVKVRRIWLTGTTANMGIVVYS